MIPKLYKYRRFDTSNDQKPVWKRVLYDGELKLSRPDTFNDPFDCNFLVDSDYLKSDFLKNGVISYLLKKEEISDDFAFSLKNAATLEEGLEKLFGKRFDKRKFNEGILKENEIIFEDIRRGILVTCLSEDVSSILMWSHYAENHQGFCVEYDLNSLPNKDILQKVEYSESRYKINADFADRPENEANRIIWESTIHKADVWSYEKEWRIISVDSKAIESREKSTAQAYLNLKRYITGVYIGAKTEEKYLSEIFNFFRNTNVKVYQMQLDKESYLLNPERIQ